MITKTEQVEVYIPDEGKALKITQNNKVVLYMIEPFYKLPHYSYEVKEVPKEEAIKWINNAKRFTNKVFRK